MNNFDEVLEQCLDKIASGESTPEECLARNPNYSSELEPVLAAARRLQRGRDVKPSPFFAARLRSELMQKSHPQPRSWFGFPAFRRMALNVAVLLLAFTIVSTTFAQSALPGESLYGLKLASESVWRMVTIDPVGADLLIAERRITEYMAVSKDEGRRARALNGYSDVLKRFESQQDERERERIRLELRSQQDSLQKNGLFIPELDSYFSGGATETSGEFPIATPGSSISRPTPKP